MYAVTMDCVNEAMQRLDLTPRVWLTSHEWREVTEITRIVNLTSECVRYLCSGISEFPVLS